MCTLIILRRPNHSWPLILAANRDEMLNRSSLPPDRHWTDRSEVIAGRDELAGGTWLGINDYGVSAAILNRTGSLGPTTNKRTRGELVLEALDHSDAKSAAEALENIQSSTYRSFNMVISDNTLSYWLRSTGTDIVTKSKIPDGLSMITSGELNDMKSPRIPTFLTKFKKAIPPNINTNNWLAWKNLLSIQDYSHQAGPHEAMCIVTEEGYGTVSSSLIALPSKEKRDQKPVWLFSDGPPNEVAYKKVNL